MSRRGLLPCCIGAILWAAPAAAQEPEPAETTEPGAPAETADPAEPTAAAGPAAPAQTAEPGEQPPAGADEPEPDPFFGVSLGAKGTAGGNVWSDPPNAPAYALVFNDTAGGWGAGGGLYTEFRVLWNYLGLEVDLLFERNRNWHHITFNRVVETDWVVSATHMRVPLLVKGIVPTGPVRVSLGLGPEFVVGLATDTDIEVTDGEQYVDQQQFDRLRANFVGETQSDTYLAVDLGVAIPVWQLAITFDLRAGFNLSQPSDHDDRITYTLDGTELTGLDVIASNSMDFRLLLGVAWDYGFDY